jgi:hypothetical protein
MATIAEEAKSNDAWAKPTTGATNSVERAFGQSSCGLLPTVNNSQAHPVQPMHGVSRWPDRVSARINLWSQLFPTKEVATLTQFDGEKCIDGWYREARAYMTSRAPDIGALLGWAEKKTEPISNSDLENDNVLCQLHASGDLVTNPMVLSHHIWGFLNTNLKGAALERHQSLDISAGLDSWRLCVKARIISRRTKR